MPAFLNSKKPKDKLSSTMLADQLKECSKTLGKVMCIKVLQNSYNILAIKERRLRVDGILGPTTIKALNSYKNPLELYVWLIMNSNMYSSTVPHDVYDDKKWINDKIIFKVKEYYHS